MRRRQKELNNTIKLKYLYFFLILLVFQFNIKTDYGKSKRENNVTKKRYP